MNARNHALTISALTLTLMFAACGKKEEPVQTAEPEPTPPPVEEPTVAVAHLATPDGTTLGHVEFSEVGGTTTVTATVSGVEPGPHGFHIHAEGDCSAEDFSSAGGHWSLGDHPHGAPTDAERHIGDLGNLMVGEDGTGSLEMTSTDFTVAAGERSVVGHAVIFHAGEDDLVSQPSGAAGARLACGVIGGNEMAADVMDGDDVHAEH